MQRLRNLNLTPDTKTGIDVNPCTRPEVTLYRETMTLGPLDPEELELFQAQFGALLAAPSSDERKLMLDRLPIYIIAMRAIKHELKNVKFRGINPEDSELGFGFIRPMFTRTAGAYRTDWLHALTPAYAAWLDTAGAAFAMGTNFGLCITHLKSLETPVPFMSECRFEIGRTGILIPFDVRMLLAADTENMTAIVPIPSMIVKPLSGLLARARSDINGTDNLALGGLVFGLGLVLRHETGALAAW